MPEYIASRIINKANGEDGLEYRLIIPKWIKYKNEIDRILKEKGKSDLIEDLHL